ncbi:hypothetical protein EYF80_019326 [Liparis tanakae]|uniref:Uncharacterized protein n=1 Tax=Liparis tanakae TaxID=230148 RepID=A0A4Z2HX86_9TELE|nr:hypothetical protein EYF80_019326 [Liparis tanakae]
MIRVIRKRRTRRDSGSSSFGELGVSLALALRGNSSRETNCLVAASCEHLAQLGTQSQGYTSRDRAPGAYMHGHALFLEVTRFFFKVHHEALNFRLSPAIRNALGRKEISTITPTMFSSAAICTISHVSIHQTAGPRSRRRDNASPRHQMEYGY